MTTTEIVRDVSTSLDMAKELFASLDIYHDIDSRSAAINMAIDEALLEIANVPTIRFYQWDHPALSFGYFGKFDEVANYQRDIVRRWTGGGIVFHGEDLTYSVVIPSSDAAFGESSISLYEKIHQAIRDALAATRKGDFQIAPPVAESSSRPNANNGHSGECFANPVRADVLLDGRKIAGAAQRRTRRGLLQQGSIQHINLANGFGDRVAEQLGQDCRSKEVNDGLVARAQEIAKERYGRETWLHKR